MARGWIGPAPVSYTHLDVYKRQVVVTFLLHVLVIGEGALIDQEQRAVDVALDVRTVGRERCV